MMQRTLGILMALLLALTALFLPTGRSEAAGVQDGDFSCRGVALGAKTIHQPHVENFVRAIRGKAQLTCDAEEAFRAEAPIYRVNEAVAAEKMLRYSPEDFAV